jgi:hypothetical protein
MARHIETGSGTSDDGQVQAGSGQRELSLRRGHNAVHYGQEREVTWASRNADKIAMLKERGGKILAVWPGKWSSDVFEVNARVRALAALGDSSAMKALSTCGHTFKIREECQVTSRTRSIEVELLCGCAHSASGTAAGQGRPVKLARASLTGFGSGVVASSRPGATGTCQSPAGVDEAPGQPSPGRMAVFGRLWPHFHDTTCPSRIAHSRL